MAYWLSCVTRENFEVDRHIDFQVDGYRERDFKKVLQVEPGDRLVYYIKGVGFAAICTARSRLFIDWKPIWKGDIYPCRLERQCDLFLPLDKALPPSQVIDQLHFVPPKLRQSRFWGLVFRGSLRPIPEEDFLLLEREMKKAARDD